MHGGAMGSGAQPGNKNAVKHGYYTAASKARRREIRDLNEALNKLCDDIGVI